MNHKQIIEAWGGYQAMAADLNESQEKVRKWYKRNRIPSEYWSDIANASIKHQKNVSLEVLAA